MFAIDADTLVLITGAGPTGLVLALWLARLRVTVRIVDKTSEPATTGRALERARPKNQDGNGSSSNWRWSLRKQRDEDLVRSVN